MCSQARPCCEVDSLDRDIELPPTPVSGDDYMVEDPLSTPQRVKSAFCMCSQDCPSLFADDLGQQFMHEAQLNWNVISEQAKSEASLLTIRDILTTDGKLHTGSWALNGKHVCRHFWSWATGITNARICNIQGNGCERPHRAHGHAEGATRGSIQGSRS